MTNRLFKKVFAGLLICLAAVSDVFAQDYPTQFHWGDITIHVEEEVELYIDSEFDYATSYLSFNTTWEASGGCVEVLTPGTSNRTYCVVKGIANTHGFATRVNCQLAYRTSSNSYQYQVWHGYYNVYVESNKVKVTSITFNKTSLSLQKGQKETLIATVKPDNATDKSVTWSSSDKDIATVDNNGKVTAVADGTATITCKANDSSGKQATCAVTVTSGDVNPTSISMRESLSMKTADTYELTYSYNYPSSATSSQKVYPSVTWSSSNTEVVTVSDGTLTAVSTGTAVVKVNSANGLTASCNVTVIVQPDPFKWNVKQVEASLYYTMILLTDGSLWACGDNGRGQLGDDTTTDCSTPKQVMTGVAAVSAGNVHTMILKTDGTLWACGWNNQGQLGDGTTTDRSTPKQVMTDVAAVSAGRYHTMILKTDGSLWACGGNHYGQLGDGTTTDCSTPKQVMTDVAAVSAGWYHNMILKTDGTLWACGWNDYGQLGDDTTTSRSTPKQVMTGVAAVSAGTAHTMILKTDGTLWACGWNDYGQLGDDTTTNRSTPKQVMIGVAAVSAGEYHTMILKTDGSLWACGRNDYGQLGDGTTTNCSTPKQVMTDVADVSAGGYHTMILKTDGTLWACGRNYHWQLGDGTDVDRHTPVVISEQGDPSLPGDVNGDGSVNGTDLVSLTNIILGKSTETSAADVNGDGSVNGTDYVALVNIILGRSSARAVTRAAGATGLSIEPFDIKAGETKEMVIDLTNPDDEITLVQFDLSLPKGLSIKKVDGDYDIDLERTTWKKHSLDANAQADGTIRFLLASNSNTVLSGTSGAIIKVTLVADNSFDGGDIKLENILMVTPDEKERKQDTYVYSLGSDKPIPSSEGLSFEPFSIKAGETEELVIDLTNPDDEITLVQFDLRLPDGLSIKKVDGDYDIDIAGRTTWKKHSLDAYAQADGSIRFLLASNSNTVLSGTDGAIIKITLVADDSYTSGDIRLENILLVTPGEKEIKPDDVGIVGIMADADKAAPVYSLSGQRLAAPRRGINIVGGRKVIIK